MGMTVYTQNQLNNMEIYKQGMNTGWFPDYHGNFLDLNEPGASTQACNFDYSQTFQPPKMDGYEQNKFYDIQLGQNMRNQIINHYGWVGHGAGPLLHRPATYYFAVTH